MKKKSYVLIVISAFACLVLWQMKDYSSISVTHDTDVPVETAAVADVPLASELLEATRPQTVEQAREPTASTELTSMKGAESLPQNEQASLWRAFSEARREIRPLTDHQKTMPGNEGALYLASNPGQKIRARFLDNGVRLLSGYAGREWEAVISLDTDGDVLEVCQQGAYIEYVRDSLIEWYHNKPEGLEHGFIVTKRTTKYTDGKLRIPVKIEGLNVKIVEDGSLQFINDAEEPVLSYNKLHVWDANGTVLVSSMMPTENGLELLIADAGAAYPITIDPLIASLEAKLIAGNGAANDNFGDSVSVSGDTALVGVNLDDDNGSDSGSAYVFVRSGSSWSQQAKLIAGDGGGGDRFGGSVSVSGDTALVGAQFGGAGGSAYVFVRSGSSWSQQAKLTADDGVGGDRFGVSVSISGDTALVGAYLDIHAGWSTGSAYVFVRSGSNWSQQAKLTADDGEGGDRFGTSVSVSGDTALVGAQFDGDAGFTSGSAYVFVRSDSSWSQQAKLTASDAAAEDQFGYSVSVSDNTALVGAFRDGDAAFESGSAYVFVRNDSSWSQQAKLTAADAAYRDWFGYSVSMSGDTALVGARLDDDNGSDSGSAYVFVRSGSSWSQQAKLIAGDAAANDQFGNSVSVSGDTALVGARLDDDYGSASGSAYVFVRNGSSWSQQAKFPADGPYGIWAYLYGLTEGAEGDDDGDGMPNFYEYGLNGNPTNAADIGIVEYGNDGAGFFTYIHGKRLDDASLVYILEDTEDLIAGPINTDAWDSQTSGPSGEAGFDAVTNKYDMTGKTEHFIHLIIE